MMRRRARPGSSRVACMPTAFLAGAALLASAALAGCAGVTGTALPSVASRSSASTSAGAAAGTPGASQAAQRNGNAPLSTAAPSPTSTPQPLAGQVIALDPGHNGANWSHPAIINRLVNVISEWKPCDTAGAQTDAGYAEHAFTFDVAMRLDRLPPAGGPPRGPPPPQRPWGWPVRDPARRDRQPGPRGRRYLHSRGRRAAHGHRIRGDRPGPARRSPPRPGPPPGGRAP